MEKNNCISNSSQCSLDLETCKTEEISEYLDDFIPLLEKELDIKLTKVKRFSFVYCHNGENIFFNIFNSPLNYDFNSYQICTTKETVCVFYLFNYYNAEQLGLSIKSFFKEVVLKGKLGHVSGSKGYYDIKFSKHILIQAYTQYEKKLNENLQYFHFKETLASRKTVFDFKNLMKELVEELSNFPHIIVENAIQSDESEACYIQLSYKNKNIKKNMKISLRNHPINTKSQMCFYAYNYESLDKLKSVFLKTIKEFNWESYYFNSEQYYDVKPQTITLKNSGHDLSKYTREQIEFISSTKTRKQNKNNGYFNYNYKLR